MNPLPFPQLYTSIFFPPCLLFLYCPLQIFPEYFQVRIHQALFFFQGLSYLKVLSFFLLLFCISWITSLSSLSSSLEASSTSSTRSAFSINFFDFLHPDIFYYYLLFFLIPAVSVSTSGIPFILIISSITSLVVPGICVTIALSSFRSEFRRVDFPNI